MNSFMSWVGGKKALREEIVKRLPLNYGRYIEVFGGGGWVLFHKEPDKFEVYNDFNQNLVNLYRCVKEKPEELIKWLEFSLDSRADFEYMTNRLKDDDLSDCQRAAYYYSLIRYSYASGVDSFGSQPHDMWKNFSLIRAAHARLRNTIIENKDFEKLIGQYDRPISFFYCDPPYYNTEDYYDGGGFGKDDHERLANTLCNIQGKFLLSYNDCPEIRELYQRPGILIEGITRINNIAQRYEGGKQYSELLISNYDTSERMKSYFQFSLFDHEIDVDKILSEKIIYRGG